MHVTFTGSFTIHFLMILTTWCHGFSFSFVYQLISQNLAQKFSYLTES